MYAIATEYCTAGPQATLTKFAESAWITFFFAVSNGLRAEVKFVDYANGDARRVSFDGKDFTFSTY
jgi:hypothetical protein